MKQMFLSACELIEKAVEGSDLIIEDISSSQYKITRTNISMPLLIKVEDGKTKWQRVIRFWFDMYENLIELDSKKLKSEVSENALQYIKKAIRRGD